MTSPRGAILQDPDLFLAGDMLVSSGKNQPRVKPLTGVEHTILARYAACNEILEYNSQILEYKKSHFEY